jgi:hypothetical protein
MITRLYKWLAAAPPLPAVELSGPLKFDALKILVQKGVEQRFKLEFIWFAAIDNSFLLKFNDIRTA